MTDLQNLIQEAWVARMAGKIPETRELLRRILEIANEEADLVLKSEITLLRVSMARADLNLNEAWALIEEAKSELARAGQDGSFQLSFQSGLCFAAASRFADSLKCYQESFRRARDNGERLLAKYNQTLALHNLGLPFQTAFNEVEALLALQPDSRFLAGLEQIRLIELERALAEADWDAVLNQNFRGLGQGLYLQALYLSLPWMRAKSMVKRDLFLELASSEAGMFQNDYRLQTVTSDVRFGGTESTLQLHVDRIYLWAWRWIESPNSLHSELLANELALFPFETAHLSMTMEDSVPLRSALAWLSCFSPKFASFFETWNRKISRGEKSATTFENLDREVREAWMAGDLDFLRPELLAKYPGCESFLNFISGLANPFVHPEIPNDSLLVKENDHLLIADEIRMISEPLARLATLLKTKDSASFEDILAYAFGIRGYDSTDHAPKVHALVQRLKKVLPNGVSLRTKNERAYLDDPENKILIASATEHQKFFPNFDVEVVTLEKKQSADRQRQLEVGDRAILISLFEKQDAFTREQIQKALGLSKATTNRHLQEWLKQGLVKRSGNGPRSWYLLA